MPDLYELRQFVTFAHTGTLSEAAKTLHLSQPALSRNMKKLEEDIGISLFIRSKNKLSLNENGKYAAEIAEKLLADADSFATKVREFDRRRRTISLGVCAPAPIWRLAPFIASLYPQLSLQTEIQDENRLLADLENNIYQLVVLHEKPSGTQFFCRELEKEHLMFSLPKNHKYALRKSIFFKEMNGENMLLRSDIGFWDFVRTEKMPDSRFLTQKDSFAFHELVQASSLPSFTSDLAEKHRETPSGRINIPIADKEAAVTYYLVCMRERKKYFTALFSL